MVTAARLAADAGVAYPILLGRPAAILAAAAQSGVSLEGIRQEDPADVDRLEQFAASYLRLRGGKDVRNLDESRREVRRPLSHGAMMVREGMADGTVGGAANTTADVLRATIRIIGLQEGVRFVLSCFFMVHPDPRWGEEGVLLYSDAGENIYPREIEEFLYRHPKIQEVQVVGVPDAKYGEEVCAWIRLREGEMAMPEEIREFCQGEIAHYKIPRYIKFVREFPMTVTGKIQKFIMRKQMIEELGIGKASV